MDLGPYFPVFAQTALAVFIGLAVIAASHIFGQRAPGNTAKNSAYECGIISEGEAHPRFGARFYLVAMLFVIFDIEIVFMLPFAMVYADFISANLPVLAPVLFFIAVLAVGILYEIKKDALNWNIPKSNQHK